MNQGDLSRQLETAQTRLDELLKSAKAKVMQHMTAEELPAAMMTELHQNIEELHQQQVELRNCLKAIAAESRYYQDLFECAPDGYLITEPDGIIKSANRAATKLLNLPSDNVVGQAIQVFMPKAEAHLVLALVTQLQQENTIQGIEVALKPNQNQASKYVSLTVDAVRDERDRLIRLHWSIHDISARIQAEMALRQRIDQESRLGQIARRIRQSLSPQEILDNAVTEVWQFLQAERVVIYRFEPEQEAIAVSDRIQPEWTFLTNEPDYLSLPKAWTTFFQQDQGLAIANIEGSNLPTNLTELAQQKQIKALLSAPIKQGNTVLGQLCAYQFSEARAWQPFEIELVNQLAEQVAIALRQSQLYQQVQSLNADLEQEVQNRTKQVQQALEFESMLKRITDKVRDSLDESQILQTAVQELTLVLGLGGCNAALYDFDRGTSTIRYEYTDSIPTSQGRVAQMDNFPEIYSQLRQGYYFQFCSLLHNPARGQVAMLACPIFVDSNSSQGIDQVVLGDLWLIHHKAYVFSEFEIRMVQQVANQCAIAIRQARLYQAAQVQVQELERLNRLKDEFLSTVSHELRTPISNVKMAIHMLKNAPNEERRQRYLAILEAESAREAELINDLLDLQRLEATCYPVDLETLTLQEWLPKLVEPFKSRIANHRQKIRINCAAGLPPLTSDFSILRRILAELLNNACKYTPAGKKIVLTVKHQVSPAESDAADRVVFKVANQAEIPATELPHIFEKFYRVPHADPWKQGGTGLGLALVHKLTEQLNGTIEVESQAGWTTFTVQLPGQFVKIG